MAGSMLACEIVACTYIRVYLCSSEEGAAPPLAHGVLVHHPVGLLPSRGPAAVEHERLPRPDDEAAGPAVHGLVLPRGLPVAQLCCAAGANAGRGLAAPRAEEVALLQVSSGSRRLLLACEHILLTTWASSKFSTKRCS